MVQYGGIKIFTIYCMTTLFLTPLVRKGSQKKRKEKKLMNWDAFKGATLIPELKTRYVTTTHLDQL